MTNNPLVSIICLCYNHENFLEEALLSVLNQDYPNKEIIVIDDCSSDGSVEKIKKIVAAHPEIIFIANEKNLGNCKTFNIAFAKSKGEFIIDFSTDDVLFPNKIRKQVDKFLTLSQEYGVVYSDAEVIDEEGKFLSYHHKGTKRANFHPEGDIFKYIAWKYFICPPTMMMRRAVFIRLGGYQTDFAYEDFNFWVDSARLFKYAFVSDVLMRKRMVKNSFSMAFYTQKNFKVFQTTLSVLELVQTMCRNEEERSLFIERVKFELKHAVMMEYYSVAEGYKQLLLKEKSFDIVSKFFMAISRNRIPVFWMYKFVILFKGKYKNR